MGVRTMLIKKVNKKFIFMLNLILVMIFVDKILQHTILCKVTKHLAILYRINRCLVRTPVAVCCNYYDFITVYKSLPELGAKKIAFK